MILHPLLIKCTGADGYQIPSVHEVMNKAMYIYDHRSPIDAATDQIHPMEQLLFPFMNFTCSGNITRLMFVANRSRESSQSEVISWPKFSLWCRLRSVGNNHFIEVVPNLGPVNPDQIVSVQPASRSAIDKQVEVVVINFVHPIEFQAGYILGIRQYSYYDYDDLMPTISTEFNDDYQLPINYAINVLRQRGGYGFRLVCAYNNYPQNYYRCQQDSKLQEMPYIAIETSKTVLF